MPMPRSLGGTKMPRVGVAHGLVGDDDLAGFRPLEPGEAAQRRGLAAAGRAEQRDQLAGADAELMPSTAFTTTLPGATKVLRRFSIANMERMILYARHRGVIVWICEGSRHSGSPPPCGERVRGGGDPIARAVPPRATPLPNPPPQGGREQTEFARIVMLKSHEHHPYPAACALAAAASLRRCTRSSSQRRPATIMISGMICSTPSAETAP